MGCLGSIGISVKAEPDPEIVKLIASIDTRLEEYKKTFEEEVNKIKEKQTEALNKRHEELARLKAEKGEIPVDDIKKLNEKELDWEIDILSNQVDQMHYIFETGLALVEPLKKITLNKLMEQVKTAPAIAANKINQQIAEIKAMPSIDFLNSTYGKVLDDALVKKGMSETVFKGYKKELMKEREERRKKEREEFDIKVNEFEEEAIDKINLEFSRLIKQEYDDINKHYRDYCRDKMIEAMHGNN